MVTSVVEQSLLESSDDFLINPRSHFNFCNISSFGNVYTQEFLNKVGGVGWIQVALDVSSGGLLCIW
jgi:hypothetical protein